MPRDALLDRFVAVVLESFAGVTSLPRRYIMPGLLRWYSITEEHRLPDRGFGFLSLASVALLAGHHGGPVGRGGRTAGPAVGQGPAMQHVAPAAAIS